jgi:hypothetical protein
MERSRAARVPDQTAQHNSELRSFCHQSGIHYSLYVNDRDLGDFVFATLPAIGLFK